MDAQDKTRAIVIKSIRYGDSSLIVKLLTETDGLQSFLVKGAFSKTSKIRAALFQPLTILDIVRTRSRSDLGFIREATVCHAFQSIPFEMNKNAIVMFVSELLSKSIQDSEPDTELFGFVHDSLLYLDELTEKYADFPLKFAVELSRQLGFAPNTNGFRNGCVFNLEDGCFHHDEIGLLYYVDSQLSGKFHDLCNSDFFCNNSLDIKNNERRELLENVITYYKLHVAGFNEMKSCEILKMVLSSI